MERIELPNNYYFEKTSPHSYVLMHERFGTTKGTWCDGDAISFAAAMQAPAVELAKSADMVMACARDNLTSKGDALWEVARRIEAYAAKREAALQAKCDALIEALINIECFAIDRVYSQDFQIQAGEWVISRAQAAIAAYRAKDTGVKKLK